MFSSIGFRYLLCYDFQILDLIVSVSNTGGGNSHIRYHKPLRDFVFVNIKIFNAAELEIFAPGRSNSPDVLLISRYLDNVMEQEVLAVDITLTYSDF